MRGFYSSGSAEGGYACPVFAVAWIGADKTGITWQESAEGSTAEVLYAGGGGATKSGVSNKVVLATAVRKKSAAAIPPSFRETSSLLTSDRICTTVHAGPLGPGNAQLIVGGLCDALGFYGVSAGRELHQLGAFLPSKDVTAVAFERQSGKVVAVGDSKGAVRLFRIENADAVLAALAAKTAPPQPPTSQAKGQGTAAAPIFAPPVQLSQNVKLFEGHSDSITALNFDSTGQRLCSASKDGTCRVWDVQKGRELATLPTTSGLPPAYAKNRALLKQMCRSCFFSPVNADIIYTLQNASRGSSYVTKWKLTCGPSSVAFEPLRVGLICGSPVPCMDIRPDGTRIIAGDTQGTLHIIDAESLKKCASYEGHQLPVSCISLAAVSKDAGATYDIVSGSGDKTIILGSSDVHSSKLHAIMGALFVLLALCALSIYTGHSAVLLSII